MKIEKVKIESTKPIKTDVELNFKQLNIFVGHNGSGKSFVQIVVWYLYVILAIISFSQKMKEFENDNERADNINRIRDLAKKVAKYTFNKDVDMSITFITDDGQEYAIDIVRDGDLIEFEFGLTQSWFECFSNNDSERFFNVGLPVYLSRNVRSFQNIDSYLQIKKMLGLGENIAETFALITSGAVNVEEAEKKFEQLCEIFPLYDVLAMEKIIDSFGEYNRSMTSGDNTVFQEIKSMIIRSMENNEEDFYEHKKIFPDEIFVKDYTVWGRYIDDRGNIEEERLASLAAGVQAIQIIILAQLR